MELCSKQKSVKQPRICFMSKVAAFSFEDRFAHSWRFLIRFIKPGMVFQFTVVPCQELICNMSCLMLPSLAIGIIINTSFLVGDWTRMALERPYMSNF